MTGILLAVVIFLLRVLNYAIGTLRLVAITRNQKLLAAATAALEALIFAVVIANIVSDLENLVNLFAYCAGAAVGSWVGMALEARLIRSYMIVNVFANQNGDNLAEALRDAGFGVTEFGGKGRDGVVVNLRSVVDKRRVKELTKLVNTSNPNAFIAVEEVQGVRRGWLGIGKGKSM